MANAKDAGKKDTGADVKKKAAAKPKAKSESKPRAAPKAKAGAKAGAKAKAESKPKKTASPKAASPKAEAAEAERAASKPASSKPKSSANGGRLRITQVRSGNGRPATHRATLRALGLKRHQQTVVQSDNAAIRGMVYQVRHLIEVEELGGEE